MRQMLGLADEAANKIFHDFVNSQKINATQINFVSKITNYLNHNGTLDIDKLYEAPFSHIHSDGPDGVFADQQVDKIIEILDHVNENAGLTMIG